MPAPEEVAAIIDIMAEVRSPCIVELGACAGEDTPFFRSAIRPGEWLHHVMVEPDPRNCQQILDMAPTSQNRRLIIGAVSDKNEMRPFHFAWNERDRSHASGSLLAPTGHVDLIPEVKFTGVGLVQCYTLDEIFEWQWLTKIDLLWCDIQGSEAAMIRGGQTALRHTRYLFIEKEHVELYGGQALRDDLIAMLPGWEMVQEFKYNMLLLNRSFIERGPR